MKIFNTLTRQKEDFVPLQEGKVKMYSCGPTVYNYFHLGNARAFIVFDTVRRYLEFRGYSVCFVQNFTDIDDKVIREARAEGISEKELADRYIREYYTDAEGLNVLKADHHPRATESINEIVELIQTLVDKGFAYVAKDGVYFAARKFPEYAKLSHFDLNDLIQNARKDVSSESGKQDSVDFALWKFKKEGEPFWPSPWGDGRPGWHIECSAMSKKYLGESIDIHSGGQDLIFPHHENEIAQSEAASGKPFVKYWMHNGFITFNGEKMSKSEGNFFTVRDIAEKFSYMPIRMFILNTHYRSPINYSLDLIDSSNSAYQRLRNCVKNLDFHLANTPEQPGDASQDNRIGESIEKLRTNFIEAMDDDFNTADALGTIFEFVRVINTELSQAKAHQGFKDARDILLELCTVLGLHFEEEEAIPNNILELVEARQEAKKAKDFAKADQLRDEIQVLGYKVTDTAQGPKIETL